MKKLTALLLVLILALALSVPALAVEAQYANTKEFLAMLDETNLYYTVMGLDQDGDELVRLTNESDVVPAYTINCFFTEDNETVIIRVWDICSFAPENTAQVLQAVNDLNRSYKYVTWYADLSDNTVSVRMDLIVRENADLRKITLEALIRLVDILDMGYPTLQPFAAAN